MNGKVLVDTNILVYAYDYSQTDKQARALAVIDELLDAETGYLSTQILSEFFVVATRKLADPLTASEGTERIENFLRIWPILDVTSLVVLEASRGVRDHRLSFWDALVWATAKLNQVTTVLSEDFNGQTLEGVTFTSPF